MPTNAEIEGEPDQRKRQRNERARDIATDELVKLHREYEKHDALHLLDPRVRIFCDDLKARNGGRLPSPKGGRPPDQHRRLLIAIKVIEKIEAEGGKRGAVERAIRQVANDFSIKHRRVREIYYDRDPGWMRELKASLALRKT